MEKKMRKGYIGVVAVLGLLLALALGLTLGGSAGGVTGGVTASGTAADKITITIADATADFGTTMDAACTAAGSSDTVTGYDGSSGNEGCAYAWKAAGSGLSVTVKSNKTWNGTIVATENAGTATGLTIAGG